MKAASPENITREINRLVEIGESRYQTVPIVRLKAFTQAANGSPLTSRDLAVSTAVQCYAPGVAKLATRSDEKSAAIANSTLDAGHHTTRQHGHYTFQFVGVTREGVASFLHNYPFYNSEQQSQRYADIKEGAYRVPANLNPKQESLFRQVGDYSNYSFGQLESILAPEVTRLAKLSYPSSWQKDTRLSTQLASKILKLTQENARYVLPLGQETTMFHTLSALQIIRLWHASKMDHVSDEMRFVVAKMITEILANDPDFIHEIRSLPEESQAQPARTQETHFPVPDNRCSVLLNPKTELSQQLAHVVRFILQLDPTTSDNEALSNLFNPLKNPYLTSVYDTGIHDPLTQAMRTANLTFYTKVSHTAESQRQRHRRTPGVQPTLGQQYLARPNEFIVPDIIKGHQESLDYYQEVHKKIFDGINACLNAGINVQDTLLLLPNSFALHVIESGDLYDWFHRWRQRTCYLAQGEIFNISIEQIQDTLVHLPEARASFQAPCGIRKEGGVKPYCPEGAKWCGQPVYNWGIEEYVRHRLI